MSNVIKTYEFGSMEYEKLQFFANVANRALTERKTVFYIEVKDCYFDYGQDWKYTALITERLNNNSSWQSVCPRDYEAILNCDSFDILYMKALEYADGIANGKICIDLF